MKALGKILRTQQIEKIFILLLARVPRVGVFYFGTGRVGYLQKSSGTGTGRDGY